MNSKYTPGSEWVTSINPEISSFAEIIFIGNTYIIYKSYVDKTHYDKKQWREACNDKHNFKKFYNFNIHEQKGYIV